MKRMAAVAACVLLAVLIAHATAQAQGTKTVRGTVVTADPDAVTVKVGDTDMKFKVDVNTHVIARGGSTATRTAKAEGKPGVPYTAIVKPGQGVEVSFREPGRTAASIRVLPSAPPSPPAAPQASTGGTPPPRSMTATGVVTAVANSSLTVKGSAGETTFTIDDKTRVIGTGAGTKSRELKKAGEKPVITDFVHKGDRVTVRYVEADGAKRASEVRVTAKTT